MSLLHYIDNEVPWDAPAHYGEWDSIAEAGGSTIAQAGAAGFPERGSYGLRCQTVAGNVAYVQKDDVISVAPGGQVWLGFWLKVAVLPAAATYISSLFIGGTRMAGVVTDTDGDLKVICRDDAGWPTLVYLAPPAASGRWLYFAFAAKRATTNVAADGWFRMYFDGRLARELTNRDNYDTWAGSLDLRAGCHASVANTLDVYLDEYKLAESYPEPFVPTPADEYLSADRLAVLYRTASADSAEFADYCVSELGVPLCNLIPLPNASADEALADYATFQTEVEDDVDAYLALNPTVAANCMGFLVGHGVPGYFTVAAVAHSAASRLMNYGTGFSSGTANPLYKPSTVERLTKTALGGKYLCCRIDGPALQNSKNLIDRAATIGALTELPDADTLWGSDASATYRASLACQKLRILTDRLMGGEGLSADDAAFIWFEGGGWGTGGSRVAVVAPLTITAVRLRTGATTCIVALHTQTFAAALGNSHTADTFDAESFFEMLRIGGTLAEAFAVGICKLDYTAVGAGSPLLTVAFQLGGHNLYANEWADLIGCVRPGVNQIDLAGLDDGREHYIGIRAVSSAGVEEVNTDRVIRVLVEGGQLIAPPPNPVWSAAARATPAGKIEVEFVYVARGQAGTAAKVQIALITAGVADWAAPQAEVNVGSRRTARTVELSGTWTHGETVRLAIRAVTADTPASAGAVLSLAPVVAAVDGPPAVHGVVVDQHGW